MLKSLILSLALLGAGAHAAQPSDPMHDTTTTMATADTPADHDRFSATRPPGDQVVEHWHGFVRAGAVTS